MGYMYINKSNIALPVFGGWPWPQRGAQIGSIQNREVFCAGLTEDGYDIDFRNSSGQVVQGFYYERDNNGNILTTSIAECIDYPYGTVQIKGVTYYTFMFRRAEEVYTGLGNRWGTVAAGMRVACRSSMTGSTHYDWKAINYVERSTDGEWIPVSGDGFNYGYVDIGLNQGSTPSTISMYGTW